MKSSFREPRVSGRVPIIPLSFRPGRVPYQGNAYVAAEGRHTAPISQDAITRLAHRFIDADFYSMDDRYTASATDLPGQVLSISVDGQSKSVVDVEGRWVGMPAVIADLEDEVDRVGGTGAWVRGDAGLVQRLRDESFDFSSQAARKMLLAAVMNRNTETVKQLVSAGVKLGQINGPVPPPILSAAATDPETLKLLIGAGAALHDQNAKDLALATAAEAGSLAPCVP